MEYEESFAAIPEGDIISQLLRESFAARNVSEQKLIANRRPRPNLVLKTKDRSFQEACYTKNDWLCGSEGMQRLFCWPCLLFRPIELLKRGLKQVLATCMVSYLTARSTRARSHLQAYKMWKTFDVSERVEVLFSRARREEIERHNEDMRQNKEMLRTF